MKYQIVCKYCGRTLFKTNETIMTILVIKTQCSDPKCKRILTLPKDTVVLSSQENKPGLEKAT